MHVESEPSAYSRTKHACIPDVAYIGSHNVVSNVRSAFEEKLEIVAHT